MNLFRILASGKLGFREEHVSAFLAYLLSPRMDHGLHGEVLKRLVERIAQTTQSEALRQLVRRLEPRLRVGLDDVPDEEVLVDLEVPYSVSGSTKMGYIDVVVKTRECFLLIENKIKASAVTSGQWAEQYGGFAKRLRGSGAACDLGTDRPIISIFLVPAEQSEGKIWVEPPFAREESAKLELQSMDLACVVTWQPTAEEGCVSIIGILDELMADDASGRISPLSYDVRQLIRSFIDFTLNEFQGFTYQRVSSTKKIGQRQVGELLNANDESLYIGIQYGFAGLIERAWMNPDFVSDSVSVSDQENGWQYLTLRDFQLVCAWAMSPDDKSAKGLAQIAWKGMPFWVRKLYIVAKAAGEGIWIGIRGGLVALKAMSREEILGRTTWQVSSFRKNSSWFSGTEFVKVLEAKGVSFDSPKDQ